MKVLHVVALMGRDAGGLARSSQGLVAELCKHGVDAWVWPLDGTEPWLPGVRSISGIVGFKQAARTPLPHFRRIEQFDLVHIHGIWSWGLHRVAVMCRKAGVPYIIAPRGMLEPWSLRQKGLKKRIARWLYQDRDLRLAAALHATAQSEAEQFRRLGFKNKIIVCPNGVNLPEGDVGLCRRSRSAEDFANSSVVGRRALFVSRMHPKKGVLELVESWARVKKEVERRGGGGQWCVELVYTVSGEMEKAYEQKVKQCILELGMTYGEMVHGVLSVKSGKDSASPFPAGQSPDFIFTGALDDEKKWEAYARADLFVLPTYSENFGIVVAEALWAGVPVITTKGTPWSELEGKVQSNDRTIEQSNNSRCGWWIDLPGPEVERRGGGGEWSALDAALREAIEQSNNPNNRTILQEMGARGHRLVAERYTWPAVCEKMIEGYEKAKGEGERVIQNCVIQI